MFGGGAPDSTWSSPSVPHIPGLCEGLSPHLMHSSSVSSPAIKQGGVSEASALSEVLVEWEGKGIKAVACQGSSNNDTMVYPGD
ncbi:hypothetical protein EOD39_14923 [Acipenser ruthenus]|uniref:Uncharacterized protein n=1 Tax=Acipenser ruthenus TaxID=7906 RepID=A0A662YJY6_ACIRT|nr:hypothetical protein EOD39_14923 [Acipenser ruthenus]